MTMGCPLALPLGGGPDDTEAEQDALLLALEDGLDPEGPEQIALTFGEALAIAITWACDTRLTGQLDPSRMIETLPTWEEACGLIPDPSETDMDRRAALGAQFLGIVGNTIAQLYQICATIAGSAFLGFYQPLGSALSYTPGLMPGPPGFEYSSVRASLGVRLSPIAGPSNAVFLDMVRRLFRALSQACPSWMTFCIGTDEGHAVCDVAVADRTLVMD